MSIIKDAKETIEKQHSLGFKVLIIGQPISGTSIPKKTYLSMLNIMSPVSVIDILHDYKVCSTVRIMSDFPIDYNRCRFVDEAIDQGTDYLMFMDMDMTFPANTLQCLFQHLSDEHPIIAGSYYMKREPFSPVFGRYVDWCKDTRPHKKELDALGFVSRGRQLLMWRSITFFDTDQPFEVDVIGMGCVLIKANVFQQMRNQKYHDVKDNPNRYFRYSNDPRFPDTHNKISEDMFFCARLKKMGIPILIDPRVQCGHIMTDMESNLSLYESQRDTSLKEAQAVDPEKYEKIKTEIIDVRGEQDAKRSKTREIQESSRPEASCVQESVGA